MTQTLIPELVDVMPEPSDMKQGVLYICEKYGTVIHLCCCGCGMQTVTPIGERGWELTLKDGMATLFPSIGNQQLPCRSHYFIQNNCVQWC